MWARCRYAQRVKNAQPFFFFQVWSVIHTHQHPHFACVQQGYDALSEESEEDPPSPRVLLHQLDSSTHQLNSSITSVSGKPPAGSSMGRSRAQGTTAASREGSASLGQSHRGGPSLSQAGKQAARVAGRRNLLSRTSKVRAWASCVLWRVLRVAPRVCSCVTLMKSKSCACRNSHFTEGNPR